MTPFTNPIYMCIVMNMNIYITSTNETNLRKYDGSMSGLVNRLLEDFFTQNPSAATGSLKPAEYASEPTKYPQDMKPACCLAQKPCKHWSFNTGTGEWINSITGEVREPSTV